MATVEVAPTEQVVGEYERLAAYLREKPQASVADALQAVPGLSEPFVRDVFRALRSTPRRESSLETGGRAVRQGLTAFGQTFARVLRRMTDRPLAFTILTGAVAVILMVALNLFAQPVVTARGAGSTIAGVGGTMMTLVLIAHIACFMRHGRVRYPLYSALAAWVVFSVAFGFVIANSPEARPQGPLFKVGIPILVGLILGGFYAIVGLIASLLGGYWSVERSRHLATRQTRQQLLERMFEIESRLKTLESSPSVAASVPKIISRIRAVRPYWLLAMVVGVGLGTVDVVADGVARWLWSADGVAESVANGLVQFALFLVCTAAYTIIGFLAGRVSRAVVALLATLAGHMIAGLIPMNPSGPVAFWKGIVEFEWLPGLVAVLILGFITGLGAYIEEQSRLSDRRRQNDPAMLIAELVQIRRRLNPGSQATCVLVVDVARSTQMKQDEDHLRVEFSFREYQSLLERVCAECGGDILSTAGDGAVATFSDPEEALRAAKTIQTEIVRFNSRINRLTNPFRLRIGLHAGQTTAQIAEAPFNELIDIAAHVEAVAPVGGIAITEAVAKYVPDEPTAGLEERVDGQRVRIVLSPQLGA